MSICSSNKTKDATPLKSSLIKKPTEIKKIDLIESISSLIEDNIKRNKDKKKYSKKSVFFCEDTQIPDISIYDYIFYIYSYLNLDFSSIVLSLISINRLLSLTKDQLSKNNFYKLFITSCLLNSKLNEDPIYDYDCYAKAGKIDKTELIYLEKIYFELIDYKLFVNDEVYKRYLDFIKSRASKSNKKFNPKNSIINM
jgi:hypothetical protein